MPLPHSYEDASLRCVTRMCDARGRFGLAFDVPGRAPLRLALTGNDCLALSALLGDYVKLAAEEREQERVEALCAQHGGHVFALGRDGWLHGVRRCVYCGAREAV